MHFKGTKIKFKNEIHAHSMTYGSTVTFDYLFYVSMQAKYMIIFQSKFTNIDATMLFKFNIILYSMKNGIKKHKTAHGNIWFGCSQKYQHTTTNRMQKKWRFGILKCKESIREEKRRMKREKTEHTVLLRLEKTVGESK